MVLQEQVVVNFVDAFVVICWYIENSLIPSKLQYIRRFDPKRETMLCDAKFLLKIALSGTSTDISNFGSGSKELASPLPFEGFLCDYYRFKSHGNIFN